VYRPVEGERLFALGRLNLTGPGQIHKGGSTNEVTTTCQIATRVVVTLGVIFLVGMLRTSPRVQAWDDSESQRIHQGFEIAPVPLNLEGKDRDLVGLGSYLDHIHPTCTADQLTAIENGATPNCIPTGPVPFAPGQSYNNIPDGDLLQVMPWPTFSHMSDHDIEAIYEYLSAIPCIDNTTSTPPAGAPNELRNDCGGDPQVSSQDSHSSTARRRAKP
jgi:hypothetical protein